MGPLSKVRAFGLDRWTTRNRALTVLMRRRNVAVAGGKPRPVTLAA